MSSSGNCTNVGSGSSRSTVVIKLQAAATEEAAIGYIVFVCQ